MQTFSFWFRVCIVFHMVALIGNVATGNAIGLVSNVGWMVLLYGYIKHEETEQPQEAFLK